MGGLGVKVRNSHMAMGKKDSLFFLLFFKETKYFSVHVTDGSNYQTSLSCVKSCTLSTKYEKEKKSVTMHVIQPAR